MSIRNTLKLLLNSPLTRHRRLNTLGRYVRWQLGSRLVPGPVAVPFAGRGRLLVRPGQHSATGNLYLGLQEFEDMAFVLHFLRRDDHFVDVGANIGAYSILAGLAGARVDAFEPVPATYDALLDNLRLNALGERVAAHNTGVGAEPGKLRFTTGLDCVNHVAREHEHGAVVELPVVRLDDALGGRVPKMIKIDVEGFETPALDGARATLAQPELQAILIELNGAGSRYGFADGELHERLFGLGFRPYLYAPKARTLSLRDRYGRRGNTLYLRDPEAAQERVRMAEQFTVHGMTL